MPKLRWQQRRLQQGGQEIRWAAQVQVVERPRRHHQEDRHPLRHPTRKAIGSSSNLRSSDHGLR